MAKAGASATYAAWSEHECCTQTLNLMNCIIKFKNKFKTLLTPSNGLLLESTDSNGSLARRKNTLVCHVPHVWGNRRELGGTPGQEPAVCSSHEPALQAGHLGMRFSKARLCLAPTLKPEFCFLSGLKDFFQNPGSDELTGWG